jgi:hypothetical protein
MVKKLIYGYLIITSIFLVLGLSTSLLGGADTAIGFLLAMPLAMLAIFLIWTSPIFLLLLVVLFVSRSSSARKIFTQAEDFHRGAR